MKRKIASAILICLSLGFLWQAVGVPKPTNCHRVCEQGFMDCIAPVKNGLGRVASLVIIGCREKYHTCMGNCVLR
jgi:hypothetical protein